MLTNVSIKKAEGSEFEPLEADVYQVQIIDVEEREGTKYKSTEKTIQFLFKTKVVEGDRKDSPLGIFTSQSWFDGGENSNPSKLYNLFKAVYGHYKKDVELKDIEEITESEINDLIGKQIRVTVTVTEKKKNKITGMMPIKKEIKYSPSSEDIEPDKVPF